MAYFPDLGLSFYKTQRLVLLDLVINHCERLRSGECIMVWIAVRGGAIVDASGRYSRSNCPKSNQVAKPRGRQRKMDPDGRSKCFARSWPPARFHGPIIIRHRRSSLLREATSDYGHHHTHGRSRQRPAKTLPSLDDPSLPHGRARPRHIVVIILSQGIVCCWSRSCLHIAGHL